MFHPIFWSLFQKKIYKWNYSFLWTLVNFLNSADATSLMWGQVSIVSLLSLIPDTHSELRFWAENMDVDIGA